MFKKVLFIVCFGTVLAVLLTPIQLCAPAHAEEPEQECWAVIVGVSHYASSVCYEDEEGNLVCDGDLKYADDDARDLYELLASIWGEDHIELLLDSQASKVDIYYAIKRLAAKADNDDTVLIYFAGHGLRQDYPAYIDYAIGSDYEMATIWQISNTMIWQDRQIVGPGYVCPFDSGQSLSWDCDYEISHVDLARWLDMLASQNIVIILDSCQSGSLSTELSQDGRVMLMGCQPGEGSLESCELEHGVFTYYILEAFRNFDVADTNRDYELSAEEIFSYAETRTINETITSDNVTVTIDEIIADPMLWQELSSVCDNVTSTIDGTVAFHNVTVSEGDEQHPLLSDSYPGELSLLTKVVFDTSADLPPDITVLTLDGEPYLSGELPASFIWVPGSVHALDIPSQMDTGEGTRLVFASWDDGDASVPRAISHGGEYTADYETQYQLTIESAWGNPVGQGWYESGEVAHVSVYSPAGIIIRRLFTGWSGDFVGTEASTLLTMDGPKTVIANWRADYFRLYVLMAGVLAVVGPAAGIRIYRRRKSL
jgi:hypothetical protein